MENKIIILRRFNILINKCKSKIMNFFKNMLRKQDLDEFEQNLARRKMDVNLSLEESEGRLRIKEELFAEKENGLSTIKSVMANVCSSIKKDEHDYHQDKETRGIEIAKLDATILLKKELFEELADQKNVEIKLLKESNSTIVANYKEMIELLKVQVEVLTAKLTELKITDAHIHVDAKMSKE